MRLAQSKPLIRAIREANPNWFSRSNKRFFHDVSYRAYYGKATGKAYLVRSTYAWTDMLEEPKRLHWRINAVSQDTLRIVGLLDDTFNDIFAVKAWLREH